MSGKWRDTFFRPIDGSRRGWGEYLYIIAFFTLALGIPLTAFLWLLIWHTAWLGAIAFVAVVVACWIGISIARGY